MLGVFATFSRAGILAGIALLAFAFWLRTGRKHLLRLFLGSALLILLGFVFAAYVVHNLDLSDDALVRVLSLTQSGGIGDYGEDRGQTAMQALDLAMENPLLGNGVGAIAEMPEGPHNMFIAMMVEYGLVGLVAYLLMITCLLRIGRHADRRLSAMSLSIAAWLVAFSFTSHNLLENTSTIPLLGLAVACTYRIRSRARQRESVREYA
jgi:O-antigen ligase